MATEDVVTRLLSGHRNGIDSRIRGLEKERQEHVIALENVDAELAELRAQATAIDEAVEERSAGRSRVQGQVRS